MAKLRPQFSSMPSMFNTGVINEVHHEQVHAYKTNRHATHPQPRMFRVKGLCTAPSLHSQETLMKNSSCSRAHFVLALLRAGERQASLLGQGIQSRLLVFVRRKKKLQNERVMFER